MKQESEKKRLPLLPGLMHEATSPDEKSYLIGSKCTICGHTFFPPQKACSVCMRNDSLEEVPLSTKGKIDTFTVVHVAPVGFSAPYIQAFVDLPEGVRIFSLVTGCEPSEDALEEGMEVEMVIDKIREDEQGNDLIGYKFRPIRERRKTKIGK